MHHVPRFFKRTEKMDRKRNLSKPKLERRNALKHIDYDAVSSSSSLDNSALITRSLDLTDRTSFRVEGNEGDFDRICRSLGLSGIDDFTIPAAAWEARRIRSSSDLLPRSRLNRLDSPIEEEPKEKDSEVVVNELSVRVLESLRVNDAANQLTRDESTESSQRFSSCSGSGGGIKGIRPPPDESAQNVTSCSGGGGIKGVRPPPVLKPLPPPPPPDESAESSQLCSMNFASCSGSGGGGIKGVRPPPVLKPPPAMTLQVIDHTSSTWDIFRDFAPESERGSHHPTFSPSSDEEEEEEEEDTDGDVAVDNREEEEERLRRIDENAVLSCSFTTSNDDDSSRSTTTNPSPNGKIRRVINSWQKGVLLGRGSFGSVYEGISDDGFFFAVKEVSLLDQGSQGKQSIFQLEQEIALLSQFEHENIVQYYGTDKDESKLYIFLELVKGSLLSLYQRYNLIDSQVCAYTRQILHGLKYLHDLNVVHRDIKCANILVDASGSVKLADFGLAKATKLNDVQSCKGTAFWMAPEVVNRKNQGYGLPADIWSLGCTVLEMLTRQIPYSELECMQALFRIGKGVPPPVPDSLSKDAQDFILRCLEVDPSDRPTAAQLLDHPFVKRPLPTSSGSASPHIGRLS